MPLDDAREAGSACEAVVLVGHALRSGWLGGGCPPRRGSGVGSFCALGGGKSIGPVKRASRLRAGGGGNGRTGFGEWGFTGLGGLRRDTEDWAL